MADQDRFRELIERWRKRAAQYRQISRSRDDEQILSKAAWAEEADRIALCAEELEAVLASPGSVSDQGWRADGRLFDLLDEAATLIDDGKIAESETMKCVYREAIREALTRLRIYASQ